MKSSLEAAFAGRRVLVTGHTGFKGAWLAEWLLALGADVTGFALPPPTSPALFDQLALGSRLRHVIGDVRDPSAVRAVVDATQPEFVFHLAAQPLVRLSYDRPVETYATNVMGTVNVLEALRLRGGAAIAGPCVAVMVTTDKCYENREWTHSYREDDPMGGFDPYSSSKAAAELVISAYRRSFFAPPEGGLPPVLLASARAGNVIGGGDWAQDRIVPDCMRSLQQGVSIAVRNKHATRPWQHVLEPLSGYLWLGALMAHRARAGEVQAGAGIDALLGPFNFGPELSSNRTVADLVAAILQRWPGSWEDRSPPQAPHEASRLNLATDKAFHLLGWKQVWSFEETIRRTVDWYRETASTAVEPAAVQRRCVAQIAAYGDAARGQLLAWACS